MKMITMKVKTVFDEIMHVNEDGAEYWVCSELASVLGTGEAMKQAEAIRDRQLDTTGTECRIIVPFERTDEETGSTEQDYMLTRKACRRIAEAVPESARSREARSYFAPQKIVTGNAWKIILGAMLALPIIYIALLAFGAFSDGSEKMDTKQDNEKLAQEAKDAGYEAVAYSCKLMGTETVDGVRYVQFMSAGRVTKDHPAIAFREDASYKIAHELRKGHKYTIYGTEIGKLTETAMLVEPYCLVRDTGLDGIGKVLAVGGRAFIALVILGALELVLFISYLITLRISTVISDD